MINSIKKLLNIAFERKTRPREISAFGADRSLYCDNPFVNAFVCAAGKRSGNESFIKNRIQDSENSMVQNPIADRCLMNMSHFWITDIKASISLMSVLLCRQIAMQLKNVLLELELKRLHILFVTLVRPKFVPRRKEIF